MFSFRGRVSRSTWWARALAASAAFTILFVFLDASLGHASTWILYPPFFWVVAAASVRRLHDRGESAWWLLVLVVPVLGPLWLLAKLALRAGNPGENQYGPDPRERDADYLVVK